MLDAYVELIRRLRLEPVLGTLGEVFSLEYPSLRVWVAPHDRWPVRVEHPSATLPVEIVHDSPFLRASGRHRPSPVGGWALGDLSGVRSVLTTHEALVRSLLDAGAVIGAGGVRWPSVPADDGIRAAAILVTQLLYEQPSTAMSTRWQADLADLSEALGDPTPEVAPTNSLERMLLVAGRPRPADSETLLRLRPLVSRVQAEAWLPELLPDLRHAGQLRTIELLMGWGTTVVERVLAQVDRWNHMDKLKIAASPAVFDASPDWCMSKVDAAMTSTHVTTIRRSLLNAVGAILRHTTTAGADVWAHRVLRMFVQQGGVPAADLAKVLRAVPSERQLPLLLALAEEGHPPTVRRLLESLADRPWSQVSPVLTTLLDRDLGGWSSPELLVPLAQRLVGDPPAEVMLRMSVLLRERHTPSERQAEQWVSVLGRTDSPAVEQELVAWLEGSGDDVVLAVCAHLERIGTGVSLPALRPYDSFLVLRKVRRAALAAIAAIESRSGPAGGLTMVEGSGGLSPSDGSGTITPSSDG